MTADAIKHTLADKIAPAAVGAIAAGALGLASDTFTLPPWMIKQIEQGGSAIFILVLIVVGVIYFIPRGSVERIIKSQEDTAAALAKIGFQLGVLTGQTGKLDEIKLMLSESHINLMVITDRIMAVEARLVSAKEIGGAG